ncbi:MAG: cation diffusion facilitator family transporter [Deltaproteobacteria bacterium]|nr:cation diffusion facilitator family transporter [Deltaproteobacteria bacterium]
MKSTEKTSQVVKPQAKEAVTAHVEIKKARSRAALSVALNLLLSIGKGVAGVLGGSSALVGDAIHSATDVVGSAAAYTGLWLAGKKHPSFPYGLYKAETLATLITSIAVIFAGYEVGRRAFLGPNTLPDVAITLPVALISLVITFSFGFYQLRTGKKLHSKALQADARDYLADGLSTLVVVFSLIGAYYGVRLDRWAAGAVSIFIFWSGGNLLFRALRDLMDEAIDRDTERKIISLVETHPRVENVERCLSRMAGGRFIVDLDVILRSCSLELAHRIGHNLENNILQTFSQVVMTKFRRLTPVKKPEGGIEAHMARAPWFLLETINRTDGEISHREYIRNPHWQAETKKGFLVGKWLLGFKPDQVIVVEKKEGTAAALLSEAGVELILSSDLAK